MRHLRIFIHCLAVIAFLPSLTLAAADDFPPLISTGSYDPRSEQGRGLKEFFSSIATSIAGPAINLEKELQKKLDDPALRTYFPSNAERTRLAQLLANDVKSRYLSRGYTNQNTLAAMRYMTDRLVGTIVVRVLLKEGIKDAARAGAWADRIKAPFDRCMSLAVSFGEAKKCAGPLENDLMKNVGLALASELPRQEFGAAPSPATYVKCLQPAAPGANDRVRACALRSVRAAASDYGRASLLGIAKMQLPVDAAEAIVKKAMPGFDQCLAKAQERAGFNACGDALVADAGALIAEEAIRRDPRVTAAFPDPKDLDAVAVAGRKAFSDCVADARRNNRRDAAGRVDTTACQSLVTRQMTMKVAEARIRGALKGKLGDEAAVDGIIKELVDKDFSDCLGAGPSQATLDSCSLKLEKNVALQAAEVMLPARLDQFLAKGGGPAAYGLDANGRQALLDGVINLHKQCLRTQVKGTDSNAIESSINGCFKATARDLALRLGKLELLRAAKANGVDVTAAPFQKITSDFLGGFGDCLDQRRDPKFSLDDYLAGLEICQAEATRSVTAQVARNELTSTVKQLLGAAGATIQKELLDEFERCVGGAKDQPATDACVAALRSRATLRLTKEGVHQRVLSDAGGTDLPAEITALDAELDGCAAKGAIDECSVHYVKEATKVIGHLKLDGTLRPLLGDEKMKKLGPALAELEGPFKACVDKVPPPIDKKMLDAFETCGNQLTEEVMQFLLLHENDDAPAAPPPAPAPGAPVSEAELSDMMARTVMCLNGSLDTAQAGALGNLEPGSLEERMLKLIGAYVSYDVRNAQGNLEPVLKEVGAELQAAGPESARRKLLDLLVQKGMADQLLKALVKRDLEKALGGGKVPPGVLAKLTDKATLDQALSGDVMARLRPLLSVGVLQPVVVDGKPLNSSSVLRSFREVRGAAIEVLVGAAGLDDTAREQVRSALKL